MAPSGNSLAIPTSRMHLSFTVASTFLLAQRYKGLYFFSCFFYLLSEAQGGMTTVVRFYAGRLLVRASHAPEVKHCSGTVKCMLCSGAVFLSSGFLTFLVFWSIQCPVRITLSETRRRSLGLAIFLDDKEVRECAFDTKVPSIFHELRNQNNSS